MWVKEVSQWSAIRKIGLHRMLEKNVYSLLSQYILDYIYSHYEPN